MTTNQTPKEKLAAAIAKLALAKKITNNMAVLPKHEAWIPAPEKQRAKELGVRWNKDANRHEYAAPEGADHPASRYNPANFAPLTNNIPYDQRHEFEELGVLNKCVDGKWHSYVMMHEDYVDLIAGLTELELL